MPPLFRNLVTLATWQGHPSATEGGLGGNWCFTHTRKGEGRASGVKSCHSLPCPSCHLVIQSLHSLLLHSGVRLLLDFIQPSVWSSTH